MLHRLAFYRRYLRNPKRYLGVLSEAFESIGKVHHEFELKKPFKLIGSFFLEFFEDVFCLFFGLSLAWSLIIGSTCSVSATVTSSLHLFFAF